MLIACALFALFTVGLVVPCLIDIATTPPWLVRRFSRRTWLVVTATLSVAGVAAWLIAGRPRAMHRLPDAWPARPSRPGMAMYGPADALHRHPAGRAPGAISGDRYAEHSGNTGVGRRPLGPDDDEDFLTELARRIRDARENGLPSVGQPIPA